MTCRVKQDAPPPVNDSAPAWRVDYCSEEEERRLPLPAQHVACVFSSTRLDRLTGYFGLMTAKKEKINWLWLTCAGMTPRGEEVKRNADMWFSVTCDPASTNLYYMWKDKPKCLFRLKRSRLWGEMCWYNVKHLLLNVKQLFFWLMAAQRNNVAERNRWAEKKKKKGRKAQIPRSLLVRAAAVVQRVNHEGQIGPGRYHGVARLHHLKAHVVERLDDGHWKGEWPC